MVTKHQYRTLFASLIVTGVAALIVVNAGFVLSGASPDVNGNADLSGSEVAERTTGTTVITSEAGGYLTAIDPNGTVVYHDTTHDMYYDVDPVANTDEPVVVYSAVDHVRSQACSPTTTDIEVFHMGCSVQVIERANIATGETTVLHSRTFPRRIGAEWHDIDRLSNHTYLVGDMYSDRALILDTESGITEWSWSAQEHYSIGGGGSFPEDWTHLNDVEQVDNNTVMVSLRNQDTVAFIDKEHGLNTTRTLGADGNHGILYEQHNPDYLHGTNRDAVLVADSENNRVVEYAWVNGSWQRSWVVGDDTQLSWPRDADRLPSGDTLITDTHNNRVVQTDQDGDIVWHASASTPYEAERLGTGAESAGGPPMESSESSNYRRESSTIERIDDGINYIGSILGVYWLGLHDVVVSGLLIVIALIWVAAEFYWSSYAVRLPFTKE